MKNFILKTTAAAMGTILILSACFLDSDSWIPFWVCMGAMAWLALFAYANNWFEGWEG